MNIEFELINIVFIFIVSIAATLAYQKLGFHVKTFLFMSAANFLFGRLLFTIVGCLVKH